MWSPGKRLLPGLLKQRPLVRSPHERRCRNQRCWNACQWSRRCALLHHAFIGLLGSRTGLSRQFAFQDAGTGVIDTQGASRVTTADVETHQVTVGLLVQGIVAQQAPSGADSSIVVALLFLQFDETFQCLEECLLEAITFGQDPLVVAVRE